MSNKRPLKAYVRYDGSGRAVSSSLIWRKNKPKVGNWKEVQGYECCDGGCKYELFVTSASFVAILHYSSTENDVCTVNDPSSYAIVSCDNKLKLFDRDTGEIAADGWYRSSSDSRIYVVTNGELTNQWSQCA
jgi:hypothetical protein